MRVRLALVPLAVAATLLAGCAGNNPATPVTPVPTTPASNGVADLKADEIVAKAQTALKNAQSFHVKGTTTIDGASLKVDFVFSGKNASGTIDGGANGISLSVLAVGETDLYLKAPEVLWASLAKIVDTSKLAAFKDKWVKVDGSQPTFAAFKDMIKREQLVTPKGTVSKGETKTINGIPAIGLIDSGDKSTLYVATQGEPYPLKGEGPGTDAIEFTEYNKAAEVKVPAAADVLDLKTITG
jgi:hypothetical protein